jgi:hypothetical protein
MIMVVFQAHNDQMKSLVGKDFAPGTLKRYETSFEHTKAFMEWKYGIGDMNIKRLDYEFVSQYDFWLKTFRNCSHNTTIKYIANFRKIVNRCIKSGLLEKDPAFDKFEWRKQQSQNTNS